MTTIQEAQERFVEVAYPRALKAAHKAFKSWHETEATGCRPGMPGENVGSMGEVGEQRT